MKLAAALIALSAMAPLVTAFLHPPSMPRQALSARVARHPALSSFTATRRRRCALAAGARAPPAAATASSQQLNATGVAAVLEVTFVQACMQSAVGNVEELKLFVLAAQALTIRQ